MDLKQDDKTIISKIVNGEKALFSTIISRYQKKVASIVYHFLYNKHDVEEVVQDVLYNVYKSLGNFKNKSDFGTYVYRIAVNRTIKWNQKSGRVVYIDNYSGYERGEVDKRADDNERKQMLVRMINKLPDNQKLALNLYTFDEFSYKEVAEIMELSLSSVESLIFRAKSNLKKMLLEKY